LLAPQTGDYILDMGCGSGEITVQLQDFVGEKGIVVGIDLSQNMLDRARENGLREFFLCDIQNLVMPNDYEYLTGSFDAVFSNATLHWCKKDPGTAVRAARQALKPGGRFIGEFCGDSCAIEVRSVIYQLLKARGLDPSALDPWYLPGPEEYKRVLEAEGFKVEHVSLNSRLFEFPGSLYGFIRTLYRDNFFGGMSDEEADSMMKELCAYVRRAPNVFLVSNVISRHPDGNHVALIMPSDYHLTAMASATRDLGEAAPSMHPALQVPEIVRMICHCGANKDIVHLAITCQDMFHIAMPIAWEEVKGVSQLIKLIRNVVVNKEKDPLGDFMTTTIEFSSPLKEEHLDRWYMYAPFVHQLEIFEDNSPHFHMPTFPALLSYARKKVLLPNLTKLVLNPREPQVMNYLFWVNVLGSSSLRHLQASYQFGLMPIVSNDRESTVMQAIVER
ncbi:hypothetical protein FRC11_015054, partial [Ceratobasidium sp. 423]